MRKYLFKIRFMIMTISFILLTFGVYLIGRKVTSFEIPIFACPINREGSIDGSCYNLSHLKGYFSYTSLWGITMFFLSILIFIILFGRMLCGFLCPFGFIQDVIYKTRGLFKVSAVFFGEKNIQNVKIIKWALLFVFFGVCLLDVNFCEICPVVAFTPLMAGTTTVLKLSFITAIVVIVGSFFKRRFWCNICPLGYFLGIFNKLSFFRLKKNCQACTECGACYQACPMEIKSIYTERIKKNITTSDCLFCTECVKVCPEENAISITFLGKKVYNASRESFFYNNK